MKENKLKLLLLGLVCFLSCNSVGCSFFFKSSSSQVSENNSSSSSEKISSISSPISEEESVILPSSSEQESSTTISSVISSSEESIVSEEHTHKSTKWTCDDNYHYHVCSCGEIFDKAEHSFVIGATIKEATIYESGIQEYICSVCGKTKQEVIPQIEHTHIYDQKVIDAKYLVSEADCENPAVYYYSCTCGETNGTTFTYGQALGHQIVVDAYVAPTYEETGLSEGSHCSRCGKVISYQEVIPKLDVGYSPRGGNSSYGYKYLNAEEKGKAMQSFYLELYSACEEFYTSTSDLEYEETTSSYISLGGYNYGDNNIGIQEAIEVWSMFTMENPAYYFLASTVSYSTDTQTIYLKIGKEYALYANRLAAQNAILQMENDCYNILSDDMTDLQKYLAIHDFIANRIDYAYDNSGSPSNELWAHNIIGVASKGAGVCESYAKTYSYLCLQNDLPCLTIPGTAYTGGSSGAHAWNYIYLDHDYYMVDVTWDDIGKDNTPSIIYSYFGLGQASASNTRTPYGPENQYIYYSFKAPVLSSSDYQLDA